MRSSIVTLIAVAAGPAASAPVGDAGRGEQIYQACTDCHSLDQNDVGPRHRGVYGRKAGSLPDYDYSDALKNAKIVWTEETLDKWLTDPQAFVPGVKMFFHLDDPQARADVIGFLKEKAK
jgi:cytochrome c